MPSMMKAAVFVEPGRIEVVDKPIPDVGPNDALIRITTTTICAPTSTSSRANIPLPKVLRSGTNRLALSKSWGARWPATRRASA